jgi:beta-lactamase class A
LTGVDIFGILHSAFGIVTGIAAATTVGLSALQSTGRDDALARVRTIAARFAGEIGVYAKHLGTGEIIELNADTRFPTASVIKVAIMVEAFDQAARGARSLDAAVRVRADAKVGGSGVLRELHDNAEVTVRDLIRLMIVVSDNTATNVLLEKTGVANVNARIAALGLRNTRLFRPTFGRRAEVDPDLEREFGLGMSTPRDLGTLMELIAAGRAGNAEACKEMRAILEAQQDNTMIPRRLPFDRHEIVVGNKTGTDEEKIAGADGVRGHVRADAAIVRTGATTYVLAIFARRVTDRSWGPDNAALTTAADISRAIFDGFVSRR